jgi:hypothetical protein
VGVRVCSNCGYPLDYAQPSESKSPYVGTIPPSFPPRYEESRAEFGYETRGQIDRSKTGLMLLLIGIVIEVIPIIGIIGFFLALAGVIMIILGRQAFGDQHSFFVGVSVALYIFGVIAVAILVASVPSALQSAISSNSDPNSLAQAVGGVFNGYLTSAIIVGAIAGLSNVLITYKLQDAKGRLMLWAGYLTSIIVGITVLLIISQAVPAAVRQSYATGSLDPAPLQGLISETQALALLGILPTLIFAAAFYNAVSRIESGAIPARGP